MENGYLTQGQEVTFIRKTLEILSQYERCMVDFEPPQRHEVTLYLNCLLGLLIIPQQSILSGRQTCIDDEQEWGIELDKIGFCPSPRCKKHISRSANEVARHIRNSLTHDNFFVLCEDGATVTHILFQDFTQDKKAIQTFEYKFSVPDLLIFVKKYYEQV